MNTVEVKVAGYTAADVLGYSDRYDLLQERVCEMLRAANPNADMSRATYVLDVHLRKGGILAIVGRLSIRRKK